MGLTWTGPALTSSSQEPPELRAPLGRDCPCTPTTTTTTCLRAQGEGRSRVSLSILPKDGHRGWGGERAEGQSPSCFQQPLLLHLLPHIHQLPHGSNPALALLLSLRLSDEIEGLEIRV